MLQRNEIAIRPARSLADYLFLRMLRNCVRQHMTNNTARIGYMQQVLFYMRKPPNVDVHIAFVGSKRAGYLLLRRENSTTMITEAVKESYRGAGVATQLVRYAQRLCPDLTAEILIDNTISIRLHQRAGFKLVGVERDVQTFRFVRSNDDPPR